MLLRVNGLSQARRRQAEGAGSLLRAEGWSGGSYAGGSGNECAKHVGRDENGIDAVTMHCHLRDQLYILQPRPSPMIQLPPRAVRRQTCVQTFSAEHGYIIQNTGQAHSVPYITHHFHPKEPPLLLRPSAPAYFLPRRISCNIRYLA